MLEGGSGSERFEGSTPTAALVSAVLAQGSSQCVNGMQVGDIM